MRVELYNLLNYSLAGNTLPNGLGNPCRVLHAPAGAGSFQPPRGALDPFDVVITDDRTHVDFMGVSGKFAFLEDRSYPLRDYGRQLAQMKETLPIELRRDGMSILLPSAVNTAEMAELIQMGMQVMPGNMFADDGTQEGRHKAFSNFTFTALLNEDGGTPPQTLVDCIAHGTVPMLVGKHHMFNYTMYFPYSVVKFIDFSIEFAINFMLSAPSDAFYVYGNSLKMVQEFFHMRYRHPFQPRLWRHAEAACKALTKPEPALAFVAIYSALKNFGRRMALRETWLPLLAAERPRVTYKFFLADTSLQDSSEVDRLARRERDMFDDMIFLAGTTDEYPIGRKGLAALKWAAHHTEALFWFKMDDDIYMRPRPIFDRLRRMQRAEAYWGAFDYSGLVVRDQTHPHYTPREVWAEDVYPPYARGAALAMSMELVRSIVDQDEKEPFKKIVVEDVSYGYYVWQLVIDRDLASVSLIDGDEKRFAMDPKCCTEESHPNNCWLPLSLGTWLAHHVTPETVRCMFAKDGAAGFYAASELRLDPSMAPGGDGAERWQAQELLVQEMSKLDATLAGRSPRSLHWTHAPTADWAGNLADLCGCVYTPPPHPGRPLQKGGLTETAAGPKLYQ